MPTVTETQPTVNDRLDGLDADVVRGPAGAVSNNNLAKWDGVTGRLLKDGGAGGGGGSGDVSGPGASTVGNLPSWDNTGGTSIDDSGVAVVDVVQAIADSSALISAVGAAGGLATLDGSSKVPFSQMPTGTSGTTVAVGNHAHAGMGDVVGPAGATDGRVAVMDGATGKLLKQGPRLEADLVAGPASSTGGNIATFNGTGGKTIQDGGKALPSGSVVGTTDTQTLSAKKLNDADVTFADNSDPTKQLAFQCSGISAGTTRTVTVPDVSDTMVLLGATQTLTGKTLTDPTLNAAGGILIPPNSTSFPGSPGTGQRHYRSDLNTWFTWDGALWLSDVQQWVLGSARASGATSFYFSNTSGSTDPASHPLLIGRKVRIVAMSWSFLGVTGGRTWTTRIRKNGSGSNLFSASGIISVAGVWVDAAEQAVGVSLAVGDKLNIFCSVATTTEAYQAACVLHWAYEG